MNETTVIIGALVVLALVGLLLWKFDVVKFTTKLPGGFEATGEGSRGTSAAPPAASVPPGATLASGHGAVAVGDGAEEAEIATEVAGPAVAAPVAATGAATKASGAGSVAIGGGARGAKISTSVRRNDSEGA